MYTPIPVGMLYILHLKYKTYGKSVFIMSKVQLQKDIRAYEGYVLSDGTLNMQHLLPKAYDLIQSYRIQGQSQLLQDILHCFGFKEGTNPKDHTDLFGAQYYSCVELKDEEEASEIWNEDIFDLFNDLAPNGYYFGSSEGDGACIGWFKSEE